MPEETDQAEISRLLADVRHDAPIPADVAARLDDRLAALVAEREKADHGQAAPVVDLGARRRRLAGRLLVAAAALVVGGVGVSQFLGQMSSGGDASTAAEDAGGGESYAGPVQGESEDDGSTSTRDRSGGSPVTGLDTGVLRTSPQTLTRDAAELRDSGRLRRYAAGKDAEPDDDTEFAAAHPCPDAGTSAGRRVLVDYDGTPGVLVFAAPQGDTQQVELFLCGQAEPERTLTLSVP